jgi:hypothetical protein
MRGLPWRSMLRQVPGDHDRQARYAPGQGAAAPREGGSAAVSDSFSLAIARIFDQKHEPHTDEVGQR